MSRHLTALLAALALATLARAESPPPVESGAVEPQPTPSEAAAPVAWSIEAIPVAASDSETRLREHRAALAPVAEVGEIEQQLTELQSTLDELAQQSEATDPGAYSLRALGDLRQQWQTKKRLLEGWGNVLDSRLQTMGAIRLELDDLAERWRLTVEFDRSEELPESLHERIGQVQADTSDTQSMLAARLEVVLTLQNGVSAADVQTADILALIDAAEARSRRGMFELDSPPLWRTWGEVIDRGVVSENVRASYARVREGLDEFFSRYQRRLERHAIALILLMIGITVLHRRGRSMAIEDEDSVKSVDLLSRPVATAWLLGLSFVPLMYPDAPIVVYQLGSLIVLPALARLALPVSPPRARPGVLIFLALVLLSGFEDMLVGHIGLRRNMLLAITAAGLLGLWLSTRPGREIIRPKSKGWERTLRVGLSLAKALLAGSMVGNVIGAVVLAQVLTWGTLQAGYNALLLILAIRALDALLIITLRTPLWQTLNVVRRHISAVRGAILNVLTLAGVMVWLWVVLDVFRIQGPTIDLLTGWLDASWQLGALHVSVGSIIAFLATIWLSIVVSRLLRFILEEDVLPRAKLPRGVPSTISMMVHYSVLALGLVAALSVAGVQPDKFVILFSAFGVGIGFGLQNIVNNFVSGLILIFERPIQIGDTIEVGPVLGSVRRIGIRASIVRTFEGAEVIVPNGDLISQRVTNWTLSDRQRRITIETIVARGSDPERVMAILRSAADDHSSVIDNPAPAAHFHGFVEGALQFKLWCWTDDSSKWIQIRTDLGLTIDAALREAGITMPHPTRDLHLRAIDAGAAAVLDRRSSKD